MRILKVAITFALIWSAMGLVIRNTLDLPTRQASYQQLRYTKDNIRNLSIQINNFRLENNRLPFATQNGQIGDEIRAFASPGVLMDPYKRALFLSYRDYISLSGGYLKIFVMIAIYILTFLVARYFFKKTLALWIHLSIISFAVSVILVLIPLWNSSFEDGISRKFLYCNGSFSMKNMSLIYITDGKEYIVLSTGPNMTQEINQFFASNVSEMKNDIYDPTNGTISKGDIVYYSRFGRVL